MKIKVVDSICGSGKSTMAIQMMNSDESKYKSYMYVTPFLKEIERIRLDVHWRKFYDPKRTDITKMNHCKEMILQGRDIATTHSLFSGADKEFRDYITANNYVLILDEVMDVVSPIQITSQDINVLIEAKVIEIMDDGAVRCIDSDYKGKFSNEVELAKIGRVVSYGGDNEKILLLWQFPIDIFECFKEVYILTYMFDFQIQAYYFKANGVEYKKFSIDGSDMSDIKLVDYTDIPHEYERLINVIDDERLNVIGDKEFSLSKSWYKSNKAFKKLGTNTYTLFHNNYKARYKNCIWTTFKGNDELPMLKIKSYSNSFVPINARATNDFREATNCAYLINKFMNPVIERYFNCKGVTVNAKMYALSELLQWIFRSAIRDNKPINIYLPSMRMRNLLIDWINKK